MITVDWKETDSEAGWVVPDGSATREFLLDKKKLKKLPRNLRDSAMSKRFKELVFGKQFLQVWSYLCSGDHDKIFLLKFPNGAWDIPWELLIDELPPMAKPPTICLARTAGKSTPVAPCIFDERLRILILKGASDGLDLDEEVRLIQSEWENLDLNVRECIEKPIAKEVTQENFPALLQEHKPHIIWFSGHGKLESEVQLFFGDRTWITASNFADLIQKSGHLPLYAVFWACNTGRADRKQRTDYCTPLLFEKLRDIGMLSVLAMQSPIKDSSACLMAQYLFRYLVAGLPLEKAIARTRAYFKKYSPHVGHSLDWASPVSWSAGIPVGRLQWKASAQKLAQFQILGRDVLSREQDRPQQLEAPVTFGEEIRANIWKNKQRMWVHGDIDEAEHRYHWIRTLSAIQIQTPLSVIAVEMKSNDPEEALQKWAESVHKQMLPRDFPWEIASILEEMMQRTGRSWDKLCSLDDLYLAIANPPPYTNNFFWNSLLSRTDDKHVAILSKQDMPEVFLGRNWEADYIGLEIDSNIIETAIRSAPRLACALAILNMPLGISYLSVQTKEDEGAASLQRWDGWKNVMIETSAGPIMTATARKYVRDNSDVNQLKDAHMDCVKILGNPGLPLTPLIREHRLTHLLEAGENEEAFVEASILIQIYQDEDRPSAILDVVKRLENPWEHLPMQIRLIVAWANLVLGQVKHAIFWLKRSQLEAPLDVAWKHCLLSEIYKSEGTEYSPENSLREIEDAIEVCKEAEEKDPHNLPIQESILAYRQDRARIIQYNFNDPEKAAEEYEELVQGWNRMPHHGINLAVVKRNYAECLRSLAEGPEDAWWAKAHDLLKEAEDLVQLYPYTPLLSEILYEEAKTAEMEEKPEEANRYLEECKEAAKRSGHYMMLTIAENRLFWNKEEFSLARWSEIESNLKKFPHGWAVRTLINSRLRVAHVLEAKRDYPGAFVQLKENLEDLNSNPSFVRGNNDRCRIAKTMAGLQFVGEKMKKPSSYWQNFLEKYSWAQDWLQERSRRNPEDFWR